LALSLNFMQAGKIQCNQIKYVIPCSWLMKARTPKVRASGRIRVAFPHERKFRL
jgi:hypothetical protein